MAYAVLRSYADGKKQQNGKSHIEVYKGHKIDDSIGSSGGFIVQTEAEARYYGGARFGWTWVPWLDSRTPEQIRDSVRPTEREAMERLLASIAGQGEPAGEDAQKIQARKKIEAERVLVSIREDADRAVKEAAAGTVAVPERVEELVSAAADEDVVRDATAYPPIEECHTPPCASPLQEYHALRRRVKALVAAGGPEQQLDVPKAELEAYCKRIGESVE